MICEPQPPLKVPNFANPFNVLASSTKEFYAILNSLLPPFLTIIVVNYNIYIFFCVFGAKLLNLI